MTAYRTITKTLAVGERFRFDALQCLTLQSASGTVGLGVYGVEQFGPFVAKQVLGSEGGPVLGPMVLVNLDAAPVAVVMVTSDRMIQWIDTSSASTVITGCTVDLPIKYTGAEGTPNPAGEAAKASGVFPVEAYIAAYNPADGKFYPVEHDPARGLFTYSDDVGAKADAAATSDTGTFSLLALIKRILTKLPSLGQTTMANSQPVVIASDQSNLPGNVKQWNGVTVATNAGNLDGGTLRVALATNSTAVSTAGFLSVKMDQTTDASTNAVVIKPTTVAGAALAATLMPGMTNNVVKASAGNLYGFSVVNKDAALLYLQGYNQTTAPTRGTGVVWWCPIKASDVVTVISSVPLFQFSTGIGFSSATTPTGAVAPTTAPDVVAYYK